MSWASRVLYSPILALLYSVYVVAFRTGLILSV